MLEKEAIYPCGSPGRVTPRVCKRQHADYVSLPRHCPSTCLNSSRSFARVGLHDKLCGVSPSPFQKDGIPHKSQLETVRQLAKLLGHLASTIQAVFQGNLHFCHLQNEKNRTLGNSQTCNSTTPLSPQAREELVWWRDNLDVLNGKALVSGSSDLVIETDASQQDWGHFAAESRPF